jgi:hypothetical protein
MRGLFAVLALLCCSAGAIWNAGTIRAASTGSINWSHDLSTAQHFSRDSGKPILWIRDDNSARKAITGPLAHPIVVDAADTLFIPLVTAETTPGGASLCFVDASGRELAAGSSGSLTTAAVLKQMVAALQAAHRDVPAYLRLVSDEYNPVLPQTATFAVGCYWEGERQIGKLDGIVATRTGTVGEDEVVEVDFDASRVGYPDLLQQVGSMRCFRSAVTPGGAKLQPSDVQQFTLAQSPEYWYLPLTALQATKINAILSQRGDPDDLLSPTQRTMHLELRDIIAHGGFDTLKELTVDRSIDGLGKYCQTLRRTVTQLGG